MDDIHIRDAMQCIEGKQIYFLKMAFSTNDYDIIICFILFLGFIDYKNKFWTPEVIEFTKKELVKDTKLKELLSQYKNNQEKVEELYNKVGIKKWIINAIILDRDNKINKILNG